MRYIVNMFKKIHFWLYFIVFNFVLSSCTLKSSIGGRGNPEGYLNFINLLYWGMGISFIIAVLAALAAIWSDEDGHIVRFFITAILFIIIA